MPSFLPEGVCYSARGDVSLVYVFLPLSPAGLGLQEQTLLRPAAQLLLRGWPQGPCSPGDAVEDTGLLASTAKEQRGRGLAAPLPARGSLGGLVCLWQSQILFS